MARIDNLTEFLEDVAGAIKSKKQYSEDTKIPAANFDTEIESIETGIDTSDATATANDIVENKTAYVQGNKIIGTLKQVDGKEFYGGTITDKPAFNMLSSVYTLSDEKTLIKPQGFVKANLPYNKLTQAINLTSDKIVKGQTVLGVEGTAQGGTEDLQEVIDNQDEVITSQQAVITELEEALDNKMVVAFKYAPNYISFYGCTLSNLNYELNNLDIRNLKTLNYMFRNCENLTELDVVQDWDTSQITEMLSVFAGCSKIKSLNLNKWNTSNVIDMTGMFNGCSQLTSLDITDFDTSNVLYMDSMFYNCSQLTSIEGLENLDTSNVTSTAKMFSGCQQLTSLNLNKWNKSNVTYMDSMFYNCSQLTSIEGLENLDTSNVTYMNNMFSGCSQLTSLDLHLWSNASAISIQTMFYGCTRLMQLDISNFDFTKYTSSAQYMNFLYQVPTQCEIKVNQSGYDFITKKYPTYTNLILVEEQGGAE